MPFNLEDCSKINNLFQTPLFQLLITRKTNAYLSNLQEVADLRQEMQNSTKLIVCLLPLAQVHSKLRMKLMFYTTCKQQFVIFLVSKSKIQKKNIHKRHRNKAGISVSENNTLEKNVVLLKLLKKTDISVALKLFCVLESPGISCKSLCPDHSPHQMKKNLWGGTQMSVSLIVIDVSVQPSLRKHFS